MSLEARIELLTAAVIELTATIGGIQVPGPDVQSNWSEQRAQAESLRQQAQLKIYPNVHADGQTAKSADKSVVTEKAMSSAPASTGNEIPNVLSKSATSESSTASAPTSEPSSPALDYVKDVKPITLRLSKEKGRDVTISVLQRFGVKGAQELVSDVWADYIAHCEKVLASGDV